jgi:CTP synthase
MELRGHSWFIGCQFHPELKSRPLDCHPLFRGLIKAAVTRRAANAARRPGKVRELRLAQ